MSLTLQSVRGLDVDAARAEIFDKLGDISGVRVTLNRILLAIYVRPNTRKLANGSFLHLPDSAVDEDKWQGKSGLVVKLGPHAYAENPEIAFTDDDKCEMGDWVLFRQGDGFKLSVNGVECVMLESERGVKAVIPRPDMVY